MPQMGKVTPNLDQQGTKTLNLTVLQRMDPSIEEILITAAHVTFYEFNIDTNQWSRKDVEGSLFVVKRNTQPRFQFVVMNRRNTENLVENLLGDFEYEVQLPYLLYRNASQEVNGIWFYNPRECEEVANLFSRILKAYVKVQSKPKVSSSKNEFEELEAVPSMSVIEGPLEPSSTASAATDGPEESAFGNFFSAALNIDSNLSNAANSRPSYHPSSTLPLTSHGSGIISPPLLTLQVSNIPLSTLPPSAAIRENPDPVGGNRVTNLVKPSSFLAPPPSSSLVVPHIASPPPTASALHPPVTLQGPYGTPMLQPFPPPTPPPSLTPATFVITREKVRDALMILVQDDRFIDVFHQALVKSQHS